MARRRLSFVTRWPAGAQGCVGRRRRAQASMPRDRRVGVTARPVTWQGAGEARGGAEQPVQRAASGKRALAGVP